jgi:hypothetical protein
MATEQVWTVFWEAAQKYWTGVGRWFTESLDGATPYTTEARALNAIKTVSGLSGCVAVEIERERIGDGKNNQE